MNLLFPKLTMCAVISSVLHVPLTTKVSPTISSVMSEYELEMYSSLHAGLVVTCVRGSCVSGLCGILGRGTAVGGVGIAGLHAYGLGPVILIVRWGPGFR